MTPPLVVVRNIRFYERSAKLRLPFKFGMATLTDVQQVFVRVEIETNDRRGYGQSAELLAAKWFDKNPNLSNEQNYDQLRRSLRHAAAAYLDAQHPASAFALHASLQPAHYQTCAADGLGGLIASFGAALIDRAILDALCRVHEVSIFDAVAGNLAGMTTHATPDLYAHDLDSFLASRSRADTMAVRHTVGMADAIVEADLEERLNDGLPESLEAVIATYAHRYFKLKIGGDAGADIDRLSRIASVLDRLSDPYHVSLDGNEQ
ncbi:MAG: mandelate racemase, partial [Alphaproteobacteria bacterium]